MGRVKPRQQKETQGEDAIVWAVQAYKTGRQSTIQKTADRQGIAYSNLQGCLNGKGAGSS